MVRTFQKWQCRLPEEKGSKSRKSGEKSEKLKLLEFMCAFRETFSRPVKPIRFLGLFDTVNSVPAFENAWIDRFSTACERVFVALYKFLHITSNFQLSSTGMLLYLPSNAKPFASRLLSNPARHGYTGETAHYDKFPRSQNPTGRTSALRLGIKSQAQSYNVLAAANDQILDCKSLKAIYLEDK